MPPPNYHPKLPPPPQPSRILFDPFNSLSTGHQTSPSRLSGSTSWRQSRSRKLSHQLRDATGGGGSQHLSDLVGAGSENWRKDGWKDNGDWESGAPGLREDGWQDIRGLLGSQNGNTKKRGIEEISTAAHSRIEAHVERQGESEGNGSGPLKKRKRSDLHTHTQENTSGQSSTTPSAISAKTAAASADHNERKNDTKSTDPVRPRESSSNGNPLGAPPSANTETGVDANTNTNKNNMNTSAHDEAAEDNDTDKPLPQIFRGLNIYLNGSTAPLISDHKLKQLFTLHGGSASILLGRRTVTHVILGEKCGGGLASGKIQKEVRGKGIKFVTARWVLDSIEKGIRQPEARYAVTEVRNRLGGSGQRSAAALLFPKERESDGG